MTQNASRCPSCGAALAPGARYCPECGRSVVERAASPLPWILGGIGGLILIVLLVLLLMSRTRAPAVTAAASATPTGPPVVAAPARTPSGPPVASAPTRPGVPEDPNRAAVRAYLDQMAAIEAHRKRIVNDLYPAMLTYAVLKNIGGMQDMLKQLDEDVDEAAKKAPPASQQQAQSTIESYRNQFRALAMDVQRIRPPVPAQRFQNGYLYSLGAYDAVIGEIEDKMIRGDISIASEGGELKGRVDQALKATDDELQRLLDRYHLTRTFTVSDQMAGGLTNVETPTLP